MEHKPLPNLGDRIAHYRRINGMSAEDLASKSGAGLTRAVITNVENGRKPDVTVTQLLALSSALGVPPAALMFDLTEPSRRYALRKEGDDTHVMLGWTAIDWVTGLNHTIAALQSPAGRESTRTLDDLRQYQRFAYLREDTEALRDHAEMTQHEDLPRIRESLTEILKEMRLLEQKLERRGVNVEVNDRGFRPWLLDSISELRKGMADGG